jgi:hypothetical protein
MDHESTTNHTEEKPSSSYYSVVQNDPKFVPIASTEEMYKDFSEELLSSIFDAKLWKSAFDTATMPENVDRAKLRMLRILVQRQTMQISLQVDKKNQYCNTISFHFTADIDLCLQ